MKKFISYALFFLFYFTIFADQQAFHYQDIIVNGQIASKGIRDCQNRYEAIKFLLDQYKRPITVLDLGAGYGYYSFKIAKDYDSTCVMIETNYKNNKLADQLLNICKQNTSINNVALLRTSLSQQDLEKLADCEHFDIILAFDYINYQDPNWQKRTDEILRLGDNIFIETPISTDPKSQEFEKYLTEKHNGKLILQNPCELTPEAQEKLFWFAKNKTGLKCHHFDLPAKEINLDLYKIESNFTSKALFKKNKTHGFDWKRGINLVTFLMLNGVYPSKEQIKQSIVENSTKHLSDFVPWNMLVQGTNIELIDQNDSEWKVDIKKSLKFTFDVINETTKSGIIYQFKEYSKRRVRKHK